MRGIPAVTRASTHDAATRFARLAGEEAVQRRAHGPAARGPSGSRAWPTAKGGDFEAGIEIIRAGLSLALEFELTAEAAEVYQRLGTAHEVRGDYGSAREALGAAVGLCRTTDARTRWSWSA